MSTRGTTPSWVATARDLYLVAMAVFVVNIVIGILNGPTSSSSTGTRS